MWSKCLFAICTPQPLLWWGICWDLLLIFKVGHLFSYWYLNVFFFFKWSISWINREGSNMCSFIWPLGQKLYSSSPVLSDPDIVADKIPSLKYLVFQTPLHFRVVSVTRVWPIGNKQKVLVGASQRDCERQRLSWRASLLSFALYPSPYHFPHLIQYSEGEQLPLRRKIKSRVKDSRANR